MLTATTMPEAPGAWSALSTLAATASIEVTPRGSDTGHLRAALESGTEVFITHLPGARTADRVAAVKAVQAAGMRPVPHVAARDAVSVAGFEADLTALCEAGAWGILLIGGGGGAKGPFKDASAALESGALGRCQVPRIALGGHPEGHPHADDPTLDRVLAHKVSLAAEVAEEVRIITQFVFEVEPVASWLERLRGAGVCAPVRVGLAGPATPGTLLRYAISCGVGPSMKALQSRPGMMTKMRRWRPDDLARSVAELSAARPELGIAGLHLYPFGGLSASAEWLEEARQVSPEPA